MNVCMYVILNKKIMVTENVSETTEIWYICTNELKTGKSSCEQIKILEIVSNFQV